jgi:hypothetical protein
LLCRRLSGELSFRVWIKDRVWIKESELIRIERNRLAPDLAGFVVAISFRGLTDPTT